MEAVEEFGVSTLAERLVVAAECFEARLAGVEMAAAGGRVSELEAELAAAQGTIAALKAGGRKTAGAGVATMLAKDGAAIGAAIGATIGAGALDAALAGLSVEQRIAVKAGLMRAGLVG